MMKDRVERLLRTENFELIDLPNNYFVFRTVEKALCSRLLFDGPWLIQGHYLAVQRWSPNFNPYCNKVRKVPVWIRVPTLPVHMYSEECMFEIGNLIGRTLKVDMNTLSNQENNKQTVERGKYARVSVEVDLNKKLQSRFKLKNHVYTVEYKGLNIICFKCGLYGYVLENCSSHLLGGNEAIKQNSPENPPKNSSGSQQETTRPICSVPGISVDEEFSAWMQLKSTVKSLPHFTEVGKKQQGKMSSAGRLNRKGVEKGSGGSRFAVLQESDPPIFSKENSNLNKKKGLKWSGRRKKS